MGVFWEAPVDAGIVSLHKGIAAQFRVIDLGAQPFVPLPPEVGLQVSKRGRSTELTSGVIAEYDISIKILDDDQKTARIGRDDYVFSIRAQGNDFFCLKGDSGSLVIDTNGAATRGLLFSSDNKMGGISYACDIAKVMAMLELHTPCTGSLDAAFVYAMRRRSFLSIPPLHEFASKSGALLSIPPLHEFTAKSESVRKFRMKYLLRAANGTLGSAIEQMFQVLAPELSEGISFDDDFAGLLDLAIGDLLVQPTVFDMLEYKLPNDFAEQLSKAFRRLEEIHPTMKRPDDVLSAFRDCAGLSMRETLEKPLTHRAQSSERLEDTRLSRVAASGRALPPTLP